MKLLSSLIAQGNVALEQESFKSPQVTYSTMQIAEESIQDEIKRAATNFKDKVTGSVSSVLKNGDTTDKAIDAMEKGLKEVRSKISSSRLERSQLTNIGKGLRKMGLEASSPDAVNKGLKTKLAALSGIVGELDSAKSKAQAGVSAPIKELKKKVDAISQVKASKAATDKEMIFTKAQLLEMLETGLKGIADYRKARAKQKAMGKIATEGIALEAVEGPDLPDGIGDAIWIVLKVIGIILITYISLFFGLWLIALAICHPIEFIVGFVVVSILSSWMESNNGRDND